jgi:hypothetical protein
MELCVQKYIREHGLSALTDDLHILVHDYPDRVVLNYNQIESPRFHPVCDECRGLILRKGTWEVICWEFLRFYNIGEGSDWKDFPMSSARIEEKVDGSIIGWAWDGSSWQASTRKMAFAEGHTPLGRTFRQVFDDAAKGANIVAYVTAAKVQHITFIFELTSPETRVVKPYPTTSLTLIGARDKDTGDELGREFLDQTAAAMGVRRPMVYDYKSLDEAIQAAQQLDIMDEGFVLVHEQPGSFRRLKCKNQRFLAIAHMRENGGLSAKRIMILILSGEQAEYRQYFECDAKYLDFCQGILDDSVKGMKLVQERCKGISDQKEFAMTMIPMTGLAYEKGVLFESRKSGRSVEEIVRGIGGDKMARNLGLKEKLSKEFGIKEEEDEEEK